METQRERRIYTDEFKRDVVAFATEQGYSAAEAARSLGINDNLIHKWRRDFQDQDAGITLKTDEPAELIRLRKENQQLKMEKEMLIMAANLKASNSYFLKFYLM